MKRETTATATYLRHGEKWRVFIRSANAPRITRVVETEQEAKDLTSRFGLRARIELWDCSTCGERLKLAGAVLRTARYRGRAYCPRPKACGEIARRAKLVVATTERMADPALRAHLSETHLRNGHPGPPHDTRCGSSGVPAPCEAKLLDALSPDWKLHHRIAYGPRGGSAYWVDLVLAAPAHIAVEIDGHSHRQTKWKAIDRRKEEFLLSRGFRVIRIPNENVEHALEGVVAFITAVVARPAADQTARPW